MRTLLLAVALLGGCATPPVAPPDRPKLIAVTCENCGCVWESYDGHRDRIKQCPNCPMSEKEFERLKEEARKRLK
jgi:hypothetical protein